MSKTVWAVVALAAIATGTAVAQNTAPGSAAPASPPMSTAAPMDKSITVPAPMDKSMARPAPMTNSTTGTATMPTTAPTTMPAAAASTSPSTSVPPIAGANSFTESQARERIEAQGYTGVSGLKQDDRSIWRGTAMKGGTSTSVALDFQGNVVGGSPPKL
jgi:uncharacterized protein involved in copper resistance